MIFFILDIALNPFYTGLAFAVDELCRMSHREMPLSRRTLTAKAV
jgi:hypothetical protein